MKAPLSTPLQRGISLLEALIAIVVMSLGILGVLGVQMRTLSNTQTSLFRAQAIHLIEDLNERMMANPNAFLNTNRYLTAWQNTPTSTTNCQSTACSNDALASFDLAQWKAQVRSQLPNGNASVFLAPDETQDSNRRQLGVMISWRENENAAANDTAFRTPIDASVGGGANNQCPAGQTCHLQYIPVVARCAPYFAGSSVQTFCPGT